MLVYKVHNLFGVVEPISAFLAVFEFLWAFLDVFEDVGIKPLSSAFVGLFKELPMVYQPCILRVTALKKFLESFLF
jgi:hypothetical protein